MRLVVDDDVVRAEVSDASPVTRSFSMLDQTAVTRRGLLLISAVSDRWGVEPSPSGKVVWFELLAGSDTRTVLGEADRLSRTGRLLLPPMPQAVSDVRRSYLRRILAQLGN